MTAVDQPKPSVPFAASSGPSRRHQQPHLNDPWTAVGHKDHAPESERGIEAFERDRRYLTCPEARQPLFAPGGHRLAPGCIRTHWMAGLSDPAARPAGLTSLKRRQGG